MEPKQGPRGLNVYEVYVDGAPRRHTTVYAATVEEARDTVAGLENDDWPTHGTCSVQVEQEVTDEETGETVTRQRACGRDRPCQYHDEFEVTAVSQWYVESLDDGRTRDHEEAVWSS